MLHFFPDTSSVSETFASLALAFSARALRHLEVLVYSCILVQFSSDNSMLVFQLEAVNS